MPRVLEPRAGRIAFICEHKDHEKDLTPRTFCGANDPVPICPEHGRMKLQKNRPYMGQPIPPA